MLYYNRLIYYVFVLYTWYDLIYDMIWYMLWFDMIWCGMIWYVLIWFDIWYDMVWYDMIWFDLIHVMMIWYDVIWYDMSWYYMIWFDMIYIIYNWMIPTPFAFHFSVIPHSHRAFFWAAAGAIGAGAWGIHRSPSARGVEHSGDEWIDRFIG